LIIVFEEIDEEMKEHQAKEDKKKITNVYFIIEENFYLPIDHREE